MEHKFIEPHSPEAEALPNHGASGVVGGVAGAISTKSVTTEQEMALQAKTERISTGSSEFASDIQHRNDVKFIVKYSAGYKGIREMPEGAIVISKESAAHFTKLGIGNVIK